MGYLEATHGDLPMKCNICQRKPEDIEEYQIEAEVNDMTPEQFVIQEEGTYNPVDNIFTCTRCYISIGMPLGMAQPIDGEITRE